METKKTKPYKRTEEKHIVAESATAYANSSYRHFITQNDYSLVKKAKEGINKMMNPTENIDLGIQNPIDQVKEDIESITGPIKRQR